MDDHLTQEQISALLDEGIEEGTAPGGGHLDECPRCRRELERMRRMRMALSALDDLEAPVGLWGRIQARLPATGGEEPSTAGARGGEGSSWLGRLAAGSAGGWIRAAAAVVLFAAGVGLGSSLGDLPAETADVAGQQEPAVTGQGGAEGGAEVAGRRVADAAAGSVPEAAALVDSEEDDAGYREALDRLQRLRQRGPSPEEAMRRPSAALEHMARLDALIRASREALRDDPANPALNQFLFEAMEERETLNDALRFSSVEIR